MKFCTYCGSKSHSVDYCPKTANGQSNLLHRRCSYCGSTDHTYEECKKHA